MKNYVIAAIVIIIIIGGILWYKGKNNATPVDNGVATSTDMTTPTDTGAVPSDTGSTTTPVDTGSPAAQ